MTRFLVCAGLLLSIFNQLYDSMVFAQESFIAWETSKDPLEQNEKGEFYNKFVRLQAIFCFVLGFLIYK